MVLSPEASHCWFIPAGRAFSDLQMLIGRCIGREGVPEAVSVALETDVSAVMVANTLPRWSLRRHALFAMDATEPARQSARLEFSVHGSRARGVRCGGRIFAREGGDSHRTGGSICNTLVYICKFEEHRLFLFLYSPALL